jgi:polar amino acid transport system ATP-binding protein
MVNKTDAPTVLKIDALSKSFGNLTVLKKIDLEIMQHHVVGVIGPSGSGKSTLLRCVNFLETPTSGSIYLDGELVGVRNEKNGKRVSARPVDLARQRANMAMVFQSFNLWPHKTALENVIETLITVRLMPHEEAVEVGMRMLKKVGLTEKANQYPSRLSGGQQQRVAIARALAMKPRVILFDEPTSALDPELVGEVLQVMGELAREGMTMVVVTHEMEFARDACDHVVFIEGGIIVDQGSPTHIFETSTNSRTRSFLSRFQRRHEKENMQ